MAGTAIAPRQTDSPHLTNAAERYAAEMHDAEDTLITLKGLIFALDSLTQESSLFMRDSDHSPEVQQRDADAILSLIRQASEQACNHSADQSAQWAFDALARAKATFTADLAAVEVRHNSNPTEAYEADIQAVEASHAAPMAEALQAMIDVPATTAHAMRLKARASALQPCSSSCPLISSITA